MVKLLCRLKWYATEFIELILIQASATLLSLDWNSDSDILGFRLRYCVYL